MTRRITVIAQVGQFGNDFLARACDLLAAPVGKDVLLDKVRGIIVGRLMHDAPSIRATIPNENPSVVHPHDWPQDLVLVGHGTPVLQLVEMALQVQGLLLSNRMSKMPGVVSFGGEGRMAPALFSRSRPTKSALRMIDLPHQLLFGHLVEGDLDGHRGQPETGFLAAQLCSRWEINKLRREDRSNFFVKSSGGTAFGRSGGLRGRRLLLISLSPLLDALLVVAELAIRSPRARTKLYLFRAAQDFAFGSRRLGTRRRRRRTSLSFAFSFVFSFSLSFSNFFPVTAFGFWNVHRVWRGRHFFPVLFFSGLLCGGLLVPDLLEPFELGALIVGL